MATAFNNDPNLKARLLREIARHREADAIAQGTYGGFSARGNFRGCAVGCAIRSLEDEYWSAAYDDHETLSDRIGVPVELLHLEDRLFEMLPGPDFKMWPERFTEAIPVGVDLSLVWSRFAVWLMVDPEFGVIRFAKTPDQEQAINRVADLYRRRLGGDEPSRGEWQSSADTARAAADAADAAVSAMSSRPGPAPAADKAAYVSKMCDRLVELLESA